MKRDISMTRLEHTLVRIGVPYGGDREFEIVVELDEEEAAMTRREIEEVAMNAAAQLLTELRLDIEEELAVRIPETVAEAQADLDNAKAELVSEVGGTVKNLLLLPVALGFLGGMGLLGYALVVVIFG